MADRYWVGGTGDWDASDTSHWAASPGGASGASAPTSADNVFFDANSGTGVATAVAGAAAANITMNSTVIAPVLGADLTIAGTFTLTRGAFDIGGNIFSVGILFISEAIVRSIAFGTGKIVVTGNAATVIEAATYTNFSFTGSGRVELAYAGATGTRTVTLGPTGLTEATALNIYVTAGTDTVSVNVAGTLDYTGFSGTVGTGGIIFYGGLALSPTATIAGTGNFSARSTGSVNITSNGATTTRGFIVSSTGGVFTFTDAVSVGLFAMVGTPTVILAAGETHTVTSFVTSGTTMKNLRSTTDGVQATISDASATNAVTYLTIRDIAATGGATWDATAASNVNAGNNTGWLFATPKPASSGLSLGSLSLRL